MNFGIIVTNMSHILPMCKPTWRCDDQYELLMEDFSPPPDIYIYIHKSL